MSNMMKVRIRGSADPWSYAVEDIETGRVIPATAIEFSVVAGDHPPIVTARVTIVPDDVDVEVLAAITTRPATAPQETVDDFAARTVSLIMEPK